MRAWIARMTEDKIDQDAIEKAGQILKEGGLVAFPTETVYGLGGNALDAKASEKIYAAKGRPSDNPLIIHIGRMEDLETVAAFLRRRCRACPQSGPPRGTSSGGRLRTVHLLCVRACPAHRGSRRTR